MYAIIAYNHPQEVHDYLVKFYLLFVEIKRSKKLKV